MSTSVQEKEPTQPKLGPIGLMRWVWRQLTSMRTALFLLLMLSVAAVPGSIFPQRSINAQRVTEYLDKHKTVGPWLDKFGFFDVFASPWFAAIYLMLIVSLLGCVIPRLKIHLKSLRSPIPKVPSRLGRLAASADVEVDGAPQDVLAAAREALGRKRYRLRQDDVNDDAPLELAAEGGRMRETGNLLFHFSLVVVIISVAAGSLLGWRGDVIVPVGSSFSSTLSRYDTVDPGPWVDLEKFPPWSITMDKLDVSFEQNVPPSSPQFGQPRSFVASVTAEEGGKTRTDKISVNHPLSMGDAEVYLLGNGYAPKIVVKDAKGEVLYDDATPFLPQDNNYKSVGAVKVTGAGPKQLGFFGMFLPTLDFDEVQGPHSVFPDLKAPALVLGLYEGNLFPGGKPQSVFSLDTQEMTQVKDASGEPLRLLVRPGQTVQLPDGRGSITLESVPRWAGLSVRSDPGKMPALIGSLVGLAGLVMSMVLRRRRIFLRVHPTDEGGSRLQIGALAKGDDPRLQLAVDDLVDTVRRRVDPETYPEQVKKAGAR
ncbi:cytochrome c biogenesis protein ResB [Yimella sp. cx-573]|nr:cytochrome c biogenesis protein ResB [Yimella sp. cx-573]